jgi:glycosyltransferase involved in cell wall biosynthesis
MESLAMGRPVVSSWVAGVPELVEAGINGWLVPPGNEEALAQALQQCLDASLETLARMGSAGQDAVQQRHDARIEGARLAGLFRNVGSVQPSLG